MKVYGFDDTDVQRGEMKAAEVDADLLRFEGEAMALLGWECCSRRFKEARDALIVKMMEEEVDDELIDVVRTLKASFIPVTQTD